MIRNGLMLPVVAAGALMTASNAHASVQLKTTGNLINQLHSSSTFTGNNFGFSVCSSNGSNCQHLFTGVQGLHDNNNLNAFNTWANTGGSSSSGGYFDNYKFTFTGVGSYFGNKTTSPPEETFTANEFMAPQEAVPEAATWMMMIFGFGVVGMAMRRKAAATNFA